MQICFEGAVKVWCDRFEAESKVEQSYLLRSWSDPLASVSPSHRLVPSVEHLVPELGLRDREEKDEEEPIVHSSLSVAG